MGVVKLVIFGVVGLLALLGVVAGGYYVTDGAVDAEITETRCGSGEVDIVTKFPVPGVPYTLVDMNSIVCNLFTQPGNVATYNLKSERVRLYDAADKECLKYDSESGQSAGNGCL